MTRRHQPPARTVSVAALILFPLLGPLCAALLAPLPFLLAGPVGFASYAIYAPFWTPSFYAVLAPPMLLAGLLVWLAPGLGLRVGALPQDTPQGLSDLSVRDVLRRSLEKVGQGDDEWRIDVLLDEIGVSYETAEGRFGALSGGWQRLILIAAAARLEDPDILILDEPTNHLDIASIEAVEAALSGYDGALLVVSHDADFLDAIGIERTIGL